MKLLLLIPAVFLSTILTAQQTTDTLLMANQKVAEKDFAAAATLLSEYNQHHTEKDALWLQARLLYWMKNYPAAMAAYDDAVANYPGDMDLRLDYARMLFGTKNFQRAREQSAEVLKSDSLHAEANVMVAYMDLWSGKMKTARQRAQFILHHYPGNTDAATILQQVNEWTAPYIKAGVGFQSDDQPKKGSITGVEAGVYLSRFFSPAMEMQWSKFDVKNRKYSSVLFRGRNKFSFGGFGLTLGAGVFHHAAANENSLTWLVQLQQKIGGALTAEAEFEKRPYQYSVASVMQPLLEHFSSLGISLNIKNKWLGRAAWQSQSFDDDNKINTVYAWLVAPVVSAKSFNLKLGYSFSSANADENRFVSAAPVEELSATTPVNSFVAGVYDPYFTPANQQVHALLGSISLPLSKHFVFNTRVGYGFSASADNPQIQLAQNMGNGYYLRKTYAPTSYTPVEWVSSLQVLASKQLSFDLEYNYQQLLFYTNQSGMLYLKYKLLHGK